MTSISVPEAGDEPDVPSPVVAPVVAPVDASGETSPPLRRLLLAADLIVLALGWSAGIAVMNATADAVGTVTTVIVQGVVIIFVGGLLLSASGLYRRSICADRRAEVSRILRSVVALNVVTVSLLLPFGLDAAGAAALAASGVWAVLLVVERGLFRDWIQVRRAAGDFGAPVVVVAGDPAVADGTAAFLDANPYLGFVVRGTIGPQDVVRQALRAGVSGVVLDARTLTGDQLTDAVREAGARGLHVHVTSGLRGVDRRRITVAPLADETFLHVAPLTLSRRQVVFKRLMDVSLASLFLLFASPFLLVALGAIKLDSRGPLFFRQVRIGHNGEPFLLYKLRTMVVDADRQLEALRAENDRSGPLFKLAHDPRITRVGRFLRASSMDELPQLLNVLEGTMSLVGPRPALADEVAQFDSRLNARLTVKPGLTGLWQVEARDLRSFDLYRRYDLLYVQNWSLRGDLGILGRTFSVVALRAARVLIPSRLGRDRSVLE